MPTLLIVDDSATLRKMIMAALRPLKFTLHEAANGLEAIEQLCLYPYDGMTLDLNMPDMHGIEFLHFLRSHTAWENLPVLVITTRSDMDSRQAALTAGANRYLNKPFQPQDLMAEVEKLLISPGAISTNSEGYRTEDYPPS